MGLIKLENRVELFFAMPPTPNIFIVVHMAQLYPFIPYVMPQIYIYIYIYIYIGSHFLLSEKFPIHVMKQEVKFHVTRALAYKNLFLTQTTP